MMKWCSWLAMLPLIILLVLFVFSPVVWVIQHSLWLDDHYTLQRFIELIKSPFYQQAWRNSMLLAVVSSLISLVISLWGVVSLRHLQEPWPRLAMALTTISSNMAGVPLAFAFIVILGTNGAVTLLLQSFGIHGFNLYSVNGLLVLYIYFQIPLGLLLLYPALDALDKHWAEAAYLLGAKSWQYWRHVALPILRPALTSTFLLLMANALGAYASAYALTATNINLLTIRIAALVSGELFLEPEKAAALSILLMGTLAVLVAVNALCTRICSVRGGRHA